MSTPGVALFKQALVDSFDQHYEVSFRDGFTVSGALDVHDGGVATIDGWTFRLATVERWRKTDLNGR